jgi:REP element-mobilizing transposase RayT
MMARPLRIEYPGAIYHITARGNSMADIYFQNRDRTIFLELLGKVCRRYHWSCYAWCLMTNHYHLVLETAEPNLSQGMRQLNGIYAQTFNRRHRRVGHLFQGPFKCILVDRDSYLLEVIRYVILNPVRARMVKAAGQYPWSSYREMIGKSEPPEWSNRDWILSQYGKRTASAQQSFIKFIRAGCNDADLWNNLRQQIYLGDEAFIEKIHAHLEIDKDLSEIPRIQRRFSGKPLSLYLNKYQDRNQAILSAHEEGGFKQKEIADYLGIHYSTVSKVINNSHKRNK